MKKKLKTIWIFLNETWIDTDEFFFWVAVIALFILGAILGPIAWHLGY